MRIIGMIALMLLCGLLCVYPAYSVMMITDADIIPTAGNEVHSGNGTLDLLFFTESSGGAENSGGGFDGDDANTDMPTGVQNPTANESYITSVGEIRDFYRLNFSDGSGGSTINEIVIFVDLNQTTGTDLYLDVLDIVLNYTQNFGDSRDNPWTNDIESRKQNATNDGYSGGTLLAQLDAFVPKLLALNQQGAGWADYGIHTSINPFDSAFSDSDRILFHWESHGHDDGGETIFLSGSYDQNISEPTVLILFSLGVSTMFWRKRK